MSTQKGEIVLVGEESKPDDVEVGFPIRVDASNGGTATGQ